MPLNILPDNTGELDSQLEERAVGVEIEFDPNREPTSHFALGVLASGIDILNVGTRTNGPESRRSSRNQAHEQRGRVLCSSLGYQNARNGLPAPIVPANLSEGARTLHTELQAAIRDLTSAHSTFQRVSRTVSSYLADTRDNVAYRNWDLGSDPTAGLELRTSPATVGEGALDAVAAAVTALDECGGEATDRCGTHVHVDFSSLQGREEVDAEAVRRFSAQWSLCCPLLTAVVSPDRYDSRAYNTFIERQQHTLPQLFGTRSTPLSSISVHGSSMNFSALNEHGTVEWRMFDGSLDPTDVTNWIRFILRFTQATQNTVWGVRYPRGAALPRIAYSDTAFERLLNFMDLGRDDLDQGLSDVADWARGRIADIQENAGTSFSVYLTSGPNWRTLDELVVGLTGIIEEVSEDDSVSQVDHAEQSVGDRLFRVYEHCRPFRLRTMFPELGLADVNMTLYQQEDFAHYAGLSLTEGRELLAALVTQNIDLLTQTWTAWTVTIQNSVVRSICGYMTGNVLNGTGSAMTTDDVASICTQYIRNGTITNGDIGGGSCVDF